MSTKRHFVVMDGLRGVAALTVAVLHLSESMSIGADVPQGQLAVDFFFMLSGFVVAYAYEQKLQTSMSFSRFSLIRLIRLYPMVFFGVTIGIISRLLDGAAGHGVSSVLGAAAFAFLLLPVPRRSAVPVSAFPLNGPLWSLTYELISNLVYAATIRWLSTRFLIVLAVIFSIALAAVLFDQHGVQASVAWGPTLIFGLARVFAPFSIGILLFRLGGRFHPRSDALAILTAMALTTILWAPIRKSAIFDLLAILIAFPTIVLMAARSPDDGPLRGIFKLLGMVSYPIYAINQPFFRICAEVVKRLGVPEHWLPFYATASFTACVLASFTILTFYDEPMRRYLSRTWLHRDALRTGRAV